MSLTEKREELERMLAETGGVVVAFSGGVDSTLLLAVAARVLGERALAVTADSPSLPRSELERARALAASLGARHIVIETDEMSDPCFTSNPPERCFYCKGHLFKELFGIARENGIDAVAYGQNADDVADFRPGAKAADGLGAISPLKDAGLTKDEIRELSREMELPTADLPASACLASRFPYGETITAEKLGRVERAEEFLRERGFETVRVRSHGDLARIEVAPERVAALAAEPVRSEVAGRLKQIGFAYVAVDLRGYRTGSMNEVLAKAITS